MTNIICFGQDRKVELEIIGGKIYNELYIRSQQLNNRMVTFAGEVVNDSLWTFTVPDSIVKKSLYFDFRTSTGDHIGFLGVIQGDTLIGRNIHFENDEWLIQLKVKYHHTTHEINYQYIPKLKKTIALQKWDADYFSIDSNQNNYLRENMADPSFSFFQSTKGYDDMLAEYASKIKKNPNSLYYINRLAVTPNFYRSKKDIEQLYYLFSNEMQRSYFGQIAYKYFSTFNIENVSLINCDTKMEERIVVDSNKHTLLIFSASWCAPCHEKIPVLKKIYEKMNMTLDMVYITIDDEKLLPQWKKLMLKENIPWRSLSLNNKELQDTWNIRAIPDYILINPNKEAQKIKLNDENDINNLYSTIQNN
jgi:thiol-disulfide isomerase/thioredoxin